MDQTLLQNVLPRDEAFAFNKEVYPIGFIPEWAVIVGLSQHITYKTASAMPYFDLQPKVQSFCLRH